jgi:hypothetical protein
MNREQLIEKADAAIESGWEKCLTNRDEIELIIDAIFPQVSTVEELEALPVGAILISDGGQPIMVAPDPRAPDFRFVMGFEHFHAEAALNHLGPLTVVWWPES